MLTEPEQTLLRRLAAFRGSFDLGAAEAVGSDGEVVAAPDLLDLIGRLVDKSWVSVEREKTTRYRLSETIRQYADEKLNGAGEGEATRRRHAAHYLGVVIAGRAPLVQSGDWLARLKAEDDNLRAAIEWAFAAGENVTALRLASGLFGYWYMSGQLVEGIARLERVLPLTSTLRRPARVGALHGLGLLRRQLGDRESAARLHDEAAKLAREIGDHIGETIAALSAAQLALVQGSIGEAQALLENTRAILEQRDDPRMVAWMDLDLGWVELAKGNPDSAEAIFRRALDPPGGRTGSIHSAVSAGAALALTAALRGDRSGSEEMATIAVEAARASGAAEVQVMVLTRMTEAAVVLEDHHRARSTLIEALRLLSDIGGRAWIATSLELAAVVCASTTGVSASTPRLLGAAQAIRDVTAEPFRFPHHELALNRLVERAEAALGPAEFGHERDQGSRLSTENAVALALSQLRLQNGEDPRD